MQMDPFSSAVEVASRIRKREVTPLQVGEFYYSRMLRLNPHLNAMASLEDDFLERAEMATAEMGRGGDLPPFFGVPIAIKDVQNVKGQPNTKSSWAVSGAPQRESDIFIERLLEAGFIPIGRTTSSELAADGTGESIKYGRTLNPWGVEITPAGSSGGSAAAVAAGLVPAVTATDGGGSIRLPAAACGLVGLKPSRGLLPQRVPNWEGSSVDGVLSRTVADTAAILDVTAGPDPYAWTLSAASTPRFVESIRNKPQALRIGILTEAPGDIFVHSDCADAARAVADRLAGEGHRIVEVNPSIIQSPAISLFREFVGPAGTHLLDYDLSQPMNPDTKSRLALIDQMSVREYVRAVAEMKRLTRILVRPWLEDFDVLVTPTSAILTPNQDVLSDELNLAAPERKTLNAMGAFSGWVNVAGLPAISIPSHVDGRGYPLGVQLIGKPFADCLLLQLAAGLEAQLQWERRRPQQMAEVPASNY